MGHFLTSANQRKIKLEVMVTVVFNGSYKDLVENGSMVAAKEKGLVRSEGKEYVVQDGDVVLFKFNV